MTADACSIQVIRVEVAFSFAEYEKRAVSGIIVSKLLPVANGDSDLVDLRETRRLLATLPTARQMAR